MHRFDERDMTVCVLSITQRLLAKEVGYAAARYGHVMFPENVNEPALRLAELLLQGVGKRESLNHTIGASQSSCRCDVLCLP